MFMGACNFEPTRLALGLGGLAATECLYECRSPQVAKSGTTLTGWSDYRGSAAPSSATTMSPSGSGNAPTQAAAFNSPVVTAVSNKVLAGTFNSTLLASGNGSIGIIGTLGTASSIMGGVSGNNSDGLIGTTSGGDYAGVQGTADTVTDSGVPDSASVVQAVVATQNGTAATAAVGTAPAQSGTITNSTNTNNKYVIAEGGGSFAATATVQAFLAMCSSAIWGAVQSAYFTLCGALRYGVPTGWPGLIAVLGGNSVVPAFYNGRYNVTASGGVASNWGDVRGAGFGPALTASGTAQPSYDGTSTLTFDGTDDVMSTGNSSLFVLTGAMSVILIGYYNGAANLALNLAGLTPSSASFASLLEVYAAVTNAYAGRGGGSSYGIATTSVADTAGGPVRVLAAATDGSTHIYGRVPNQAEASVTVGAQNSGNNSLYVGGVTTFLGACVVKHVIVLSRHYTTADLANILAFAEVDCAAQAA